jgi:hypothetical protein
MQADGPPSWVLPVTVAGAVMLVSEPGVLMSVGPICAYPNGFVFYLTIGLNPRYRAGVPVNLRAYTDQERSVATKLRVRFSDGRVADSLSLYAADAGDLVLRFSGGRLAISDFLPVPRAESRWWVPSLPPPGPVEFTVFLRGAAEPTGRAQVDGSQIIDAAGGSQVLWPAAGSGAE